MQRKRISVVMVALVLSLLSGLRAEDAAPRSHIDVAGMDLSIKPFEDFYEYANGKWVAAAKIPADRPSIAMFTELQDRNRDVLRHILEAASKDHDAPRDSNVAKVGAFYRSGMDQVKIDAAGAKPLQGEFDRIVVIAGTADLVREIAHLHGRRVSAAFRFGPIPDAKNSRQVIAGLYQGGLGLPDREYYLKPDDKTKAIRAAYLATIEKMFKLLGTAPERAKAAGQTILDIETRLAKASKSRVELRDPQANYHKMTVADLEAQAPGLDWKLYFQSCGLEPLHDLNVAHPAFAKELASMVAAVPLDDWKTYLSWHLLSSYADKLSTPFETEDFHFHSTVLRGIPEMQPRWKRVLEAADHLLGEALGQLYVARTFPPEARARAEVMVNNIKAALRDRLTTLDWMSPVTREQALKKLDAIAVKVGYPSKWKDYSGLKLDHETYVENVMAAEAFERQRDLAKIGKPVDRSEWGVTPPTVNAYYSSLYNEIVFPAGILQPPFFDAHADDALNYGAIGMVIGHELTHGFDDQGRQYDAEGICTTGGRRRTRKRSRRGRRKSPSSMTAMLSSIS